ncbi:type IV secretory system conjugative DNA transfer family protein, partial [Streptococcus canis]
TYSQHGSSSDSIQTISRDLMTPDEVARIGIDEALVFISKQNVFKDKKYRLEDHPNYEALAKDPDDPKWYDYDMSMDDIPE